MMNVNLHSVSFKSRNPSVIKADKICRMVKNEFPSISSSKIGIKSKIYPECKFLASYYKKLREDIYNLTRDSVLKEKNTLEKYIKWAENVKKYKLANCDELTRLASIICCANGIKFQFVMPWVLDKDDNFKKGCQHVALAIPLSGKITEKQRMGYCKDVIIIDPWLGIADYAPNVANIYKNIYPKYLGLAEKNNVGLEPLKFKHILSEEDAENIKKAFPEYVFKD